MSKEKTNPTKKNTWLILRVYRGGTWRYNAEWSLLTYNSRDKSNQNYASRYLGFRVVLQEKRK